MSRYFEDFTVGESVTTPGVTLTESSIIEFALKYDPQRFHVDTVAAEKSPYGGLIASGFHTMLLAFRNFFNLGLIGETGLGSPGVDELRWTAPVRPGDTIYTKVTIREKRESKSRPDRGIVHLHFAAYNQRNEEVMTFTTVALIKRRDGGG